MGALLNAKKKILTGKKKKGSNLILNPNWVIYGDLTKGDGSSVYWPQGYLYARSENFTTRKLGTILLPSNWS